MIHRRTNTHTVTYLLGTSCVDLFGLSIIFNAKSQRTERRKHQE
jgi:hypothetical protein